MSSPDIGKLAALGLPILCSDTCTVLDLIRDPTREAVRLHERQSGIDLLSAMEAHKLICLLAEQVQFEIGQHVQDVEGETVAALKKLQEKVAEIDAVAAIYGGTGRANLDHLNDHAIRARSVLERWTKAAISVTAASDVPGRALARLNQARTPARRGKDSMKDCVIIETYLDDVRDLRAAGLTSKIVFVSSNTKDYVGESGSHLKPDLAEEFAALGLQYAPNLGAAKHLLGF